MKFLQITEKPVYPKKDTILQLTTLEAEMSHCIAVGTTRRGVLALEGGLYSLDMHYNLYKQSVAEFEEQRRNLINLMNCYGVKSFVSTALFHGTTNVAYANQNGIRILSAGKGKTAHLASNYDRFDRAKQLAADGIIVEPGSGIVPVTYSADCVTGVFCAPNGAYGVFHSMARLLANEDENIIAAMIKAFERLYAVEAKNLELVLYPSASLSVYEVDEEFADAFEPRYVAREHGKKPRLDLQQIAIDIARGHGVMNVAWSTQTTAWGGLESYRGAENSFLANGDVGKVNAQNIVFAVPRK